MSSEILPSYAKANHPLIYSCLHDWIKVLFAAAGGIHIVTPDSLPGPGKKVESGNHDTFLDPFLLGVINNEPLFPLGKDSLKTRKSAYVGKWLLGPFMNTTFITRTGQDRDILGSMGEFIDENNVATLSFLTGTRRSDAMPKTGVAHMAIKASSEGKPTPIVPIGHSLGVWRPGRPVQAVFGKPIYAPENGRELEGFALKSARRELTEQLADSVNFLKTQAIVLDEMRAGKRFRVVRTTYTPECKTA